MINKYPQWILVLVLMVTFMAPPILTAAITNAEYFFDANDNGAGNNTSLAVVETNGIATATGTNLSTNGLTSGVHTIYSRLYDDQYGWGKALGKPFLITQVETEYVISAAEYFFDGEDGGQGSNAALTISVSNGIATATGTDLVTDGLAPGLHIVYSRFYADNYGWGPTRGIPFLITDSDVNNTITSAEYFIDSDPGQGQGISLAISGTNTQVNINQAIDLSEESPGLHSLTVRFYSPETGWGAPRSALFQVGTDAAVQYIQSAQYFIGDTPDNSEIITVTSPSDGTFDELNEALELVDLEIPVGSNGMRTVGVRFQRNDGFWSPWQTTSFMVVQDGPLYTISAAEYFIDVDPGPGNGTAITEPEDGTFDEITEEFDLPVAADGLALGGHTVYLRLQRSDGNWGTARGSYFIVSEDAQPTIAGAEYYVNPTTSEGSGIAFSPLDGAFNTTKESVSAIANMASLNAQTVGNYTLFVRYMNSRGEWGPVSSQSFTVETRPQITSSLDTLDFGALFTGETRSLSLTLSNVGDADLIVTELNFDDAAYSTDWTGGTIVPQDAISFDVTFAPVDPEGNHNATMTLVNNDLDKQITLLGVGLDTAPIMAVVPDSLDFGTVQTIASASSSVRVSNSGNEDLILSGATSTNTAFSASIANSTVSPGQYVDVDITFAPSLGETYTDTLYLLSNDTYFPSFPIHVSGAGSIAPVSDIQTSLPSLEFGNIALEDAPAMLNLIISNTGTETLNISNITIDEPVFTNSHSGIQTIAASTSLAVTITFNPTESGRYNGTMTISNDDPDSPELSLELSGSSVFPDMVLSTNTFNFGDVGVTASSSQALIITNLGSDTLKISSFLKVASIDTVLDISPASFNINPAGGQRAFSLEFDPAEPVDYEGIIVIISNTENDTLYMTGTGIDDEPPEIVFEPADFENVGTSENSTISISAPITDNNQLSWVRLYFRQGGKATYDSTDMVFNGGVYQGDIPSAYVKNRGVEYYIRAFDGANAQVIPETAPDIPAIIRVRLPSLPPIAFNAEEYGMISVPSDLDAKHVKTILEDDISPYDINDWRLFRWINGNYVELSENDNFTFEPGNAYWLITGGRQVITLDSSTSVKTNEEYLISLDQGWNQVGTPYYFPVSWNDIIAASPGIIQGSIAYEWVNNEWQPATVMEPFGGYFVSTPAGGNILRFPPREAIGSSAKAADNPFNLKDDEWIIQISASTESSQDLFNYIGVLQDAELRGDLRDQPQPPPMIPGRVQLSSVHTDWDELNGVYSGDFQSPAPQGNYWDLTLETGKRSDDILLSLKTLGNLPEGYLIKVFNRSLRYPLPSNKQLEYTQKVFSKESTYQLRVVVGDAQFIADHDEGIGVAPTEYALTQNFPNPFNGETRIHFEIPEPVALQIVIYDLGGRVVRTLARSDTYPVGRYELIWDGNNEQGYHVASGIYLISLQSAKFQETRKMVLLK